MHCLMLHLELRRGEWLAPQLPCTIVLKVRLRLLNPPKTGEVSHFLLLWVANRLALSYQL